MMQPIKETSQKKSPRKFMKSSLELLKRSVKIDLKDTRSDCSIDRQMKFHCDTSSVSLSDADEETVSFDKFGSAICDECVTVPQQKETISLHLSTENAYSTSEVTWADVLRIQNIMLEKKEEYNDLVAMCNDDRTHKDECHITDEHRTDWHAIERDLRRTFPNHSIFRESKEEEKFKTANEAHCNDVVEMKVVTDNEPYGKQAMRRILRAYSIYDKEVSYCQGMNFIVGMLLTVMSEEESFWVLVVIMNDEPYELRETFGRDMAGTHEILYIADKLVNLILPDLYEHFESEQVHTSMFCTQWLMTIYTSTFPFNLVKRVWDSFLARGWKIVYKTFLALLVHARDDGDIMNHNMEGILAYFRRFQSEVDGEKIMEYAKKIPLKQSHIQKFASEFKRLTANGELKVHDEVIQRYLCSNDESTVTTSSQLGRIQRFIRLKRTKDMSVIDYSPKLVPVAYAAKLLVMISDILSPEECAELIQRAERETMEDVFIRKEGTEKSDHIVKCKKTSIVDFGLAEDLFTRVLNALEGIPELAEKFSRAPWMKKTMKTSLEASGANDHMVIIKLGFGDSIAPLKDSKVTRGNETSYVSMQVYLNDNFRGGVTSFRGDKRYFDVKPKRGSILLFDQDLRHEECEVVKGRRYMLRTDVMYTALTINESDA